MIIRLAKNDDVESIQQINKLTLGYDFPLPDTVDRLKYILSKPNDKIFVADDNGAVVGYIHGSDYDCTYSLPLKNIMALGVLESHRGKGIGRLLLNAIEEWAKSDDCVGVRLVSSLYRTEAHKFYLSCGYFDRKDQKNFMKLFEK